jgi:hypothetical protein
MKHLKLLVAGLVALAIAGCGGDGNDSDTPSIENLSAPRVEAVVRVERSNLLNPAMYTDEQLRDPSVVKPSDLIVPTVLGVQDLTNFQTDESYYFQLVAYSDSGRRVILPATFSSSDTEFTHGVVGDSGLFLASNVPSDLAEYVYADYQGVRYVGEYEVRERRVRYLNRVVLRTGGVDRPLANAKINFYDPSGRYVGTVTSGYDGTFRASLPLNTALFTVDPHSLAGGASYSFIYNGTTHLAGDVETRALIAFDQTGTVDESATMPIVVTTR